MAVRAIVLAAGAGTRMKSAVPKVLHEIAGQPLVGWVLRALEKIDPTDTTIVILEGYAHVDVLAASDNEAVPVVVDFVNRLLQQKLLGL